MPRLRLHHSVTTLLKALCLTAFVILFISPSALGQPNDHGDSQRVTIEFNERNANKYKFKWIAEGMSLSALKANVEANATQQLAIRKWITENEIRATVNGQNSPCPDCSNVLQEIHKKFPEYLPKNKLEEALKSEWGVTGGVVIQITDRIRRDHDQLYRRLLDKAALLTRGLGGQPHLDFPPHALVLAHGRMDLFELDSPLFYASLLASLQKEGALKSDADKKVVDLLEQLAKKKELTSSHWGPFINRWAQNKLLSGDLSTPRPGLEQLLYYSNPELNQYVPGDAAHVHEVVGRYMAEKKTQAESWNTIPSVKGSLQAIIPVTHKRAEKKEDEQEEEKPDPAEIDAKAAVAALEENTAIYSAFLTALEGKDVTCEKISKWFTRFVKDQTGQNLLQDPDNFRKPLPNCAAYKGSVTNLKLSVIKAIKEGFEADFRAVEAHLAQFPDKATSWLSPQVFVLLERFKIDAEDKRPVSSYLVREILSQFSDIPAQIKSSFYYGRPSDLKEEGAKAVLAWLGTRAEKEDAPGKERRAQLAQLVKQLIKGRNQFAGRRYSIDPADWIAEEFEKRFEGTPFLAHSAFTGSERPTDSTPSETQEPPSPKYPVTFRWADTPSRLSQPTPRALVTNVLANYTIAIQLLEEMEGLDKEKLAAKFGNYFQVRIRRDAKADLAKELGTGALSLEAAKALIAQHVLADFFDLYGQANGRLAEGRMDDLVPMDVLLTVDRGEAAQDAIAGREASEKAVPRRFVFRAKALAEEGKGLPGLPMTEDQLKVFLDGLNGMHDAEKREKALSLLEAAPIQPMGAIPTAFIREVMAHGNDWHQARVPGKRPLALTLRGASATQDPLANPPAQRPKAVTQVKEGGTCPDQAFDFEKIKKWVCSQGTRSPEPSPISFDKDQTRFDGKFYALAEKKKQETYGILLGLQRFDHEKLDCESDDKKGEPPPEYREAYKAFRRSIGNHERRGLMGKLINQYSDWFSRHTAGASQEELLGFSSDVLLLVDRKWQVNRTPGRRMFLSKALVLFSGEANDDAPEDRKAAFTQLVELIKPYYYQETWPEGAGDRGALAAHLRRISAAAKQVQSLCEAKPCSPDVAGALALIQSSAVHGWDTLGDFPKDWNKDLALENSIDRSIVSCLNRKKKPEVQTPRVVEQPAAEEPPAVAETPVRRLPLSADWAEPKIERGNDIALSALVDEQVKVLEQALLKLNGDLSYEDFVKTFGEFYKKQFGEIPAKGKFLRTKEHARLRAKLLERYRNYFNEAVRLATKRTQFSPSALYWASASNSPYARNIVKDKFDEILGELQKQEPAKYTRINQLLRDILRDSRGTRASLLEILQAAAGSPPESVRNRDERLHSKLSSLLNGAEQKGNFEKLVHDSPELAHLLSVAMTWLERTEDDPVPPGTTGNADSATALAAAYETEMVNRRTGAKSGSTLSEIDRKLVRSGFDFMSASDRRQMAALMAADPEATKKIDVISKRLGRISPKSLPKFAAGLTPKRLEAYHDILGEYPVGDPTKEPGHEARDRAWRAYTIAKSNDLTSSEVEEIFNEYYKARRGWTLSEQRDHFSNLGVYDRSESAGSGLRCELLREALGLTSFYDVTADLQKTAEDKDPEARYALALAGQSRQENTLLALIRLYRLQATGYSNLSDAVKALYFQPTASETAPVDNKSQIEEVTRLLLAVKRYREFRKVPSAEEKGAAMLQYFKDNPSADFVDFNLHYIKSHYGHGDRLSEAAFKAKIREEVLQVYSEAIRKIEDKAKREAFIERKFSLAYQLASDDPETLESDAEQKYLSGRIPFGTEIVPTEEEEKSLRLAANFIKMQGIFDPLYSTDPKAAAWYDECEKSDLEGVEFMNAAKSGKDTQLKQLLSLYSGLVTSQHRARQREANQLPHILDGRKPHEEDLTHRRHRLDIQGDWGGEHEKITYKLMDRPDSDEDEDKDKPKKSYLELILCSDKGTSDTILSRPVGLNIRHPRKLFGKDKGKQVDEAYASGEHSWVSHMESVREEMMAALRDLESNKISPFSYINSHDPKAFQCAASLDDDFVRERLTLMLANVVRSIDGEFVEVILSEKANLQDINPLIGTLADSVAVSPKQYLERLKTENELFWDKDGKKTWPGKHVDIYSRLCLHSDLLGHIRFPADVRILLGKMPSTFRGPLDRKLYDNCPAAGKINSETISIRNRLRKNRAAIKAAEAELPGLERQMRIAESIASGLAQAESGSYDVTSGDVSRSSSRAQKLRARYTYLTNLVRNSSKEVKKDQDRLDEILPIARKKRREAWALLHNPDTASLLGLIQGDEASTESFVGAIQRWDRDEDRIRRIAASIERLREEFIKEHGSLQAALRDPKLMESLKKKIYDYSNVSHVYRNGNVTSYSTPLTHNGIPEEMVPEVLSFLFSHTKPEKDQVWKELVEVVDDSPTGRIAKDFRRWQEEKDPKRQYEQGEILRKKILAEIKRIWEDDQFRMQGREEDYSGRGGNKFLVERLSLMLEWMDGRGHLKAGRSDPGFVQRYELAQGGMKRFSFEDASKRAIEELKLTERECGPPASPRCDTVREISKRLSELGFGTTHSARMAYLSPENLDQVDLNRIRLSLDMVTGPEHAQSDYHSRQTVLAAGAAVTPNSNELAENHPMAESYRALFGPQNTELNERTIQILVNMAKNDKVMAQKPSEKGGFELEVIDCTAKVPLEPGEGDGTATEKPAAEGKVIIGMAPGQDLREYKMNVEVLTRARFSKHLAQWIDTYAAENGSPPPRKMQQEMAQNQKLFNQIKQETEFTLRRIAAKRVITEAMGDVDVAKMRSLPGDQRGKFLYNGMELAYEPSILGCRLQGLLGPEMSVRILEGRPELYNDSNEDSILVGLSPGSGLRDRIRRHLQGEGRTQLIASLKSQLGRDATPLEISNALEKEVDRHLSSYHNFKPTDLVRSLVAENKDQLEASKDPAVAAQQIHDHSLNRRRELYRHFVGKESGDYDDTRGLASEAELGRFMKEHALQCIQDVRKAREIPEKRAAILKLQQEIAEAWKSGQMEKAEALEAKLKTAIHDVAKLDLPNPLGESGGDEVFKKMRQDLDELQTQREAALREAQRRTTKLLPIINVEAGTIAQEIGRHKTWIKNLNEELAKLADNKVGLNWRGNVPDAIIEQRNSLSRRIGYHHQAIRWAENIRYLNQLRFEMLTGVRYGDETVTAEAETLELQIKPKMEEALQRAVEGKKSTSSIPSAQYLSQEAQSAPEVRRLARAYVDTQLRVDGEKKSLVDSFVDALKYRMNLKDTDRGWGRAVEDLNRYYGMDLVDPDGLSAYMRRNRLGANWERGLREYMVQKLVDERLLSLAEAARDEYMAKKHAEWSSQLTQQASKQAQDWEEAESRKRLGNWAVACLDALAESGHGLPGYTPKEVRERGWSPQDVEAVAQSLRQAAYTLNKADAWGRAMQPPEHMTPGEVAKSAYPGDFEGVVKYGPTKDLYDGLTRDFSRPESPFSLQTGDTAKPGQDHLHDILRPGYERATVEANVRRAKLAHLVKELAEYGITWEDGAMNLTEASLWNIEEPKDLLKLKHLMTAIKGFGIYAESSVDPWQMFARELMGRYTGSGYSKRFDFGRAVVRVRSAEEARKQPGCEAVSQHSTILTDPDDLHCFVSFEKPEATRLMCLKKTRDLLETSKAWEGKHREILERGNSFWALFRSGKGVKNTYVKDAYQEGEVLLQRIAEQARDLSQSCGSIKVPGSLARADVQGADSTLSVEGLLDGDKPVLGKDGKPKFMDDSIYEELIPASSLALMMQDSQRHQQEPSYYKELPVEVAKNIEAGQQFLLEMAIIEAITLPLDFLTLGTTRWAKAGLWGIRLARMARLLNRGSKMRKLVQFGLRARRYARVINRLKDSKRLYGMAKHIPGFLHKTQHAGQMIRMVYNTGFIGKFLTEGMVNNVFNEEGDENYVMSWQQVLEGAHHSAIVFGALGYTQYLRPLLHGFTQPVGLYGAGLGASIYQGAPIYKPGEGLVWETFTQPLHSVPYALPMHSATGYLASRMARTPGMERLLNGVFTYGAFAGLGSSLTLGEMYVKELMGHELEYQNPFASEEDNLAKKLSRGEVYRRALRDGLLQSAPLDFYFGLGASKADGLAASARFRYQREGYEKAREFYARGPYGRKLASQRLARERLANEIRERNAEKRAETNPERVAEMQAELRELGGKLRDLNHSITALDQAHRSEIHRAEELLAGAIVQEKISKYRKRSTELTELQDQLSRRETELAELSRRAENTELSEADRLTLAEQQKRASAELNTLKERLSEQRRTIELIVQSMHFGSELTPENLARFERILEIHAPSGSNASKYKTIGELRQEMITTGRKESLAALREGRMTFEEFLKDPLLFEPGVGPRGDAAEDLTIADFNFLLKKANETQSKEGLQLLSQLAGMTAEAVRPMVEFDPAFLAALGEKTSEGTPYEQNAQRFLTFLGHYNGPETNSLSVVAEKWGLMTTPGLSHLITKSEMPLEAIVVSYAPERIHDSLQQVSTAELGKILEGLDKQDPRSMKLAQLLAADLGMDPAIFLQVASQQVAKAKARTSDADLASDALGSILGVASPSEQTIGQLRHQFYARGGEALREWVKKQPTTGEGMTRDLALSFMLSENNPFTREVFGQKAIPVELMRLGTIHTKEGKEVTDAVVGEHMGYLLWFAKESKGMSDAEAVEFLTYVRNRQRLFLEGRPLMEDARGIVLPNLFYDFRNPAKRKKVTDGSNPRNANGLSDLFRPREAASGQ